jgi:hypothetical protein
MKKLPALTTLLLTATSALGSGHGPVFGMATPTNAKAGWSLDIGTMGRNGNAASAVMSRAMISYGVTQDFQLSFTAPYVFSSAPFAPARTTAMMSSTPDFEGIAAWRFQRQGTNIGRRFESTAYGGFIMPGPQRPKGMLGNLARAPGFYTAIASGMASRSHYIWVGVGNVHFVERKNDQRPNLFTYSAVWGYRPRSLRKDYPHWDWRAFAEMNGEIANKVLMQGVEMTGTGGHQLFVGPSVLGIYKNYAIEAGTQFPVFCDLGAGFERERFRYAVNLSYFF